MEADRTDSVGTAQLLQAEQMDRVTSLPGFQRPAPLKVC